MPQHYPAVGNHSLMSTFDNMTLSVNWQHSTRERLGSSIKNSPGRISRVPETDHKPKWLLATEDLC